MKLTLALTMIATPALAEDLPAMLEVSTPRPFFATAMIGPAIEVAGDWGTQVKIGQDFGYHLNGGMDGVALGVSFEESFGNCTDADGVRCVSLELGPKLWWDFQPFSSLAFFVGPAARLALAYVHLTADGLDRAGRFVGVGLQLSVEARLVLSDRAILFFRPVTVDVIAGDSNDVLSLIYDDHVAARYDLTFGGGFAF
jgi:hypothetical protein